MLNIYCKDYKYLFESQIKNQFDITLMLFNLN